MLKPVAFLAVALCGSTAFSQTIIYDLTVPGPTFSAAPRSFTVDEVTLSVDSDTGAGVTTRTGLGLGVRSSFFDSNLLDSAGADESITFTFDREVILNDFDFALFQAGPPGSFFADDFGLIVDGVVLAGGNAISADPFDASSLFTDAQLTGTEFTIFTDGGGDEFRISSVTVTPTPEPASLALWGAIAGTTGLGMWRRKRTA